MPAAQVRSLASLGASEVTMDRQQLLDKITVIDLEIGDIRERAKILERKIAMGHEEAASEDARQLCTRFEGQVRSLVEQKRALRAQISDL